ncbi:AAA family ATPase [Georgenia sp. H159]|uniref:AAA family ATPase n=1 Tax=Georgenia sp. H159 TaxID=3076115 RepID=UPI002D773790|nr:AAA family ATPase [Georgenia sp. H159]
MTRIVLAGAAPDVERTFSEATGGAHLTLPGPVDLRPADLLGRLGGAPAPDLLVVDARPDPEATLSLAQQFHGALPGIGLLLLTDRPEALSLPAMRAGVRDLIPAGAEPAEIRRLLDHAAAGVARLAPSATTPGTAPGRSGRVITVASPKGGVGKTTVATNIAVALARTLPHSTVIVDLDLQFGDVATALNLTPEYSVPDALQSAAAGDTIALKTYLTLHPTGLYVLAAPEHPAAADGITSEQVSGLIQALAAEFAFVVVDTSPGLSDHTLAALDRTTDPLLITALSVPGVRGMRKVVDALDQLQMFADGHHVVVNFADGDHGLTRADVEANLGMPVGTSLPTSKAAPASLNLGIPLMQSQMRDPLSRALAPLVDDLLPDGVSVPRGGRHLRARKGQR